MCSCTQTIFPKFINTLIASAYNTNIHNIFTNIFRILYNTKFGVSAITYFRVLLITDTHIHTQRVKESPATKKCDFWIQGSSKCLNSSKLPFQKFQLLTILSLPQIAILTCGKFAAVLLCKPANLQQVHHDESASS